MSSPGVRSKRKRIANRRYLSPSPESSYSSKRKFSDCVIQRKSGTDNLKGANSLSVKKPVPSTTNPIKGKSKQVNCLNSLFNKDSTVHVRNVKTVKCKVKPVKKKKKSVSSKDSNTPPSAGIKSLLKSKPNLNECNTDSLTKSCISTPKSERKITTSPRLIFISSNCKLKKSTSNIKISNPSEKISTKQVNSSSPFQLNVSGTVTRRRSKSNFASLGGHSSANSDFPFYTLDTKSSSLDTGNNAKKAKLDFSYEQSHVSQLSNYNLRNKLSDSPKSVINVSPNRILKKPKKHISSKKDKAVTCGVVNRCALCSHFMSSQSDSYCCVTCQNKYSKEEKYKSQRRIPDKETVVFPKHLKPVSEKTALKQKPSLSKISLKAKEQATPKSIVFSKIKFLVLEEKPKKRKNLATSETNTELDLEDDLQYFKRTVGGNVDTIFFHKKSDHITSMDQDILHVVNYMMDAVTELPTSNDISIENSTVINSLHEENSGEVTSKYVITVPKLNISHNENQPSSLSSEIETMSTDSSTEKYFPLEEIKEVVDKLIDFVEKCSSNNEIPLQQITSICPQSCFDYERRIILPLLSDPQRDEIFTEDSISQNAKENIHECGLQENETSTNAPSTKDTMGKKVNQRGPHEDETSTNASTSKSTVEEKLNQCGPQEDETSTNASSSKDEVEEEMNQCGPQEDETSTNASSSKDIVEEEMNQCGPQEDETSINASSSKDVVEEEVNQCGPQENETSTNASTSKNIVEEKGNQCGPQENETSTNASTSKNIVEEKGNQCGPQEDETLTNVSLTKDLGRENEDVNSFQEEHFPGVECASAITERANLCFVSPIVNNLPNSNDTDNIANNVVPVEETGSVPQLQKKHDKAALTRISLFQLMNCFPDDESIIVEKNVKKNRPGYKCVKCSKVFNQIQMCCIHNCKANLSKIVSVEDIEFICTMCRNNFANVAELLKHRHSCSVSTFTNSLAEVGSAASDSINKSDCFSENCNNEATSSITTTNSTASNAECINDEASQETPNSDISEHICNVCKKSFKCNYSLHLHHLNEHYNGASAKKCNKDTLMYNHPPKVDSPGPYLDGPKILSVFTVGEEDDQSLKVDAAVGDENSQSGQPKYQNIESTLDTVREQESVEVKNDDSLFPKVENDLDYKWDVSALSMLSNDSANSFKSDRRRIWDEWKNFDSSTEFKNKIHSATDEKDLLGAHHSHSVKPFSQKSISSKNLIPDKCYSCQQLLRFPSSAFRDKTMFGFADSKIYFCDVLTCSTCGYKYDINFSLLSKSIKDVYNYHVSKLLSSNETTPPRDLNFSYKSLKDATMHKLNTTNITDSLSCVDGINMPSTSQAVYHLPYTSANSRVFPSTTVVRGTDHALPSASSFHSSHTSPSVSPINTQITTDTLCAVEETQVIPHEIVFTEDIQNPHVFKKSAGQITNYICAACFMNLEKNEIAQHYFETHNNSTLQTTFNLISL